MISKRQYLVFGRLFYECLLLNLCVFLVLFVRTPDLLNSFSDKVFISDLGNLLAVFNFSWLIILLANGDPESQLMGSFQERSRQVIRNGFILIGIVATLTILFKIEYFNRSTLLIPIFLFTLANILLLKPLFEFMQRRNRYSQHNYHVLVVGNGLGAEKISEFTRQNAHLGYELVGVVGDDLLVEQGKKLGNLRDLEKILDSNSIDEIYINLPQNQESEIKSAIRTADLRGIRVNLVPETPIYLGKNYRSYSLDSSLPVYQLRNSPLDKFSNYLMKKAFDVVFSALVLLVLSPVFLIIALLIKLESKGPVFYKPIRKGEAGNTFRCLKFRTMSECDDPKNGTRSTVKDDPRITKIGRFLRKYDLDELPQFINVLRGEMSVVGPRPHRINLQNDFRKIVDEYMVRHYIKPGLTGWAQVNGWRGPTESVLQKTERIKHDLWYIENWSFFLDLRIVFLTIFGKSSRMNAF